MTLVDELHARQEIADALFRYCRGVDRLDADLILSAYHPDAYDDHGTFAGPVTEFAVYAIGALREKMQATSHRVSNIRIEFNGDLAAVECYLLASHLREVDGVQMIEMLGGRYLDCFERRAGWRILHRKLVLDWDFQTQATPIALQELFNRGTREADDPSRQLFATVASGRRWPDIPSMI